jgi:hypothetical protein
LLKRNPHTAQAGIADTAPGLVCIIQAELSDETRKCCTRIPFNRDTLMRLHAFAAVNCEAILDRYGANFIAMAVRKGQTEWLGYVSEFIAESKASGLVQQAMERTGTRGVTVVPPGKPN